MKITIEYNFFEKELSFIKNNMIREMTAYVIEYINPAFFVEAASSTGKYHPEYSLGFAGLYRHTQAAVKIAHDLLKLKQYDIFTDDEKDYIIAALILHDSCKRGVSWDNKYTIHEHPIRVAALLRDALDDLTKFDNAEHIDTFINEVNTLVSSHMGEWTTARYSSIVLPAPITPAQQFVHLCDYLASRKWLEVKINVEE